MKLSFFAFLIFANCYFAFCQRDLSIVDSVTVLNQVIVRGYSADRPLNEVSAAIGIIDTQKTDRFNSTSLLPAVNTIPGVRMEERSPGSYRFAIRGSSLRSPFGVRNVKMYWNGLPLTDGGGNTYLNLIDLSAIGSAEIIKGPGSSLYGAGTGGVVLLATPSIRRNEVQFSTSFGSYGLQRYQLRAQGGSKNLKAQFQFAHQQSDGYRVQSAMRKDAANMEVRARVHTKGTLSATLFYTDLFYETPGGLTLAEFNTDKKQARPNKPTGAEIQQASIHNQTIYAGATYEHEWNQRWSNRTGVYGSHTRFINPAIRNYEVRLEDNFGGRTETHFKTEGSGSKSNLTFGGEFQYFKSPLTDYGNRKGVRDTLQFADHLGSTQGVIFLQEELELASGFILSAGASTTFLQYRFLRTSEANPQQQNRNFTPVVSPRIAVLKKFAQTLSAYASISQGFSTPSLAEVRPSSNLYNNTLAPEYGRNYEIGIRGELFESRFNFELTGYYFSLNKTIVSPDGGDHYTNSGKTRQPGVEVGAGWNVIKGAGIISAMKIWTSATYSPYKFRNYHVGIADYSGNTLTGIAKDNIVVGLDVVSRLGIYCNLTTTHTGAIPLNDANDLLARSYYLGAARIGYRMTNESGRLFDFFGGVDNAFNARYSLGNDLNAIGRRYFNAAAPQNFFIGAKIIL